jgi:hypothetical protein
MVSIGMILGGELYHDCKRSKEIRPREPEMSPTVVFFSVTRTGKELFRNFASLVQKFCYVLPACIEKIFLKDSLLTMFFLQSHWVVLGELGSAFI